MSRRYSRRMGNWKIDVESLVKGTQSENRVENVLNFLLEMGVISGFRRSRPYDELDLMGADFEFSIPKSEKIYYLQVKSSFRGLEEHFRKYGRKIPCVVVLNSRDDGRLISDILEATKLNSLETV